MSDILIHLSAANILKGLDSSVSTSLYWSFSSLQEFREAGYPDGFRTVDIVENSAVEFRINLFRKSCLATFGTSRNDLIYLFHSSIRDVADTDLSDDLVDEAQNYLQDMFDGIDVFAFEL